MYPVKTKKGPKAGAKISQIINRNPGQMLFFLRMRPKAGTTWFTYTSHFININFVDYAWLDQQPVYTLYFIIICHKHFSI